jgi:hypothetical protein
MRFLFLLLVLLLSPGCSPKKALNSSRYTGIYSYGTDPEKEAIGTILIYPETDSTLLFYLDVNRGAPSYHMGSLFGEIKIINNAGIFISNDTGLQGGCKLEFKFSEKLLTIKTIKDQSECGFGYSVYADGIFQQVSDTVPAYFETQEGEKVYFKDKRPEDFYK